MMAFIVFFSPLYPGQNARTPRAKRPDTPGKTPDDIRIYTTSKLEGGASPESVETDSPPAVAFPCGIQNKEELENREKLANKTKTRKRIPPGFVCPPLEEVKRYFAEAKLTIDPVEFFEYYTQTVVSAGQKPWTDKNGKAIKNWKLKAQTWQRFQGGKKLEDDLPAYAKKPAVKLPFGEHECNLKIIRYRELPEGGERAKLRQEIKVYFRALGEEWDE